MRWTWRMRLANWISFGVFANSVAWNNHLADQANRWYFESLRLRAQLGAPEKPKLH